MSIYSVSLRRPAYLVAGILCAATAIVGNTATAQPGSPTEADCPPLVGNLGARAMVDSAEWISEDPPTPAHCLVLGHVTTGNASLGFNEVNFKAWLPAPWNGKYHMQGGGGFVSPVDTRGPTQALDRGYAQIYTDTGHQANGLDASWAQDNPTAVVDFGYRGVHVAAKAGKRLVKKFYQRKPDYSYFEGCSRGGGQAMMESQRFPQDFDGIIAGAPAYNWTGFMTGFAVNEQHMYPDRNDLSTPALPAAKLPLLESLVDANCDGIDGIFDGIIDDPRQCSFNTELIPVCPANAPECMTLTEIDAVKAVYDGPSNSLGQIFPGFPVGNEGNPSGWFTWIVGPLAPGLPNLHFAFSDSFFRFMAFADNDDGSFTLHDFDPENFDDLQPIGEILNATDTDLRRFARHGKIIFWNGWSDAAITALGTIQYFEAITVAPDQSVDDFARLYLAPGMQHCGGGEGPNQFDMLTALENWVELGTPPAEIVAVKRDSNGDVEIERPLCPYPQVARLIDPAGSTTEASNFECVEPF